MLPCRAFPEQAMTVQQAAEALLGNNVDYLPLGTMQRRDRGCNRRDLSARHWDCGSRHDDRAQPMLDYFLAFEAAFNRFPCFAHEVQGDYPQEIDGKIRFHTYVVKE